MKYGDEHDAQEPADEAPPSHSLLTIAKLVAWLKAPFVALGRKLNGGHGEDGDEDDG